MTPRSWWGWVALTVLGMVLCLAAADDASTVWWSWFWQTLAWVLNFALGAELAHLLEAAQVQQEARERASWLWWRQCLGEEGVRPEMSESPASYDKDV